MPIFLIVPTMTVVVGAFQAEEGGFTLDNGPGAARPSTALNALLDRACCSPGATAVVGAVLGALLAYLVVTGRRPRCCAGWCTAVCGVLAQFGGVPLAFAFVATLGSTAW